MQTTMGRLLSMLLSLVLVLAALCACGALSGCKYTEVLTHHVEDPQSGVLDERQEPVYKEVQGAPLNPNLTSTVPGESTRIDEQTAQLPVYDEGAGANGLTANRLYDPKSTHDVPATQGMVATDNEGKSTDGNEQEDEGESSQTGEEDEGSAANSEQEGDEESDEATGDSNVEGDDAQGGDSATGGQGGSAAIYDDGTYEELPEAVGHVAATGQYATIVQMLAGRGGLVAADKKWLAAVKASGAFKDEDSEGISAIATGWTGDGTASSSADIDAIIKAAPGAVLLESGNSSLSASQQKALTEAGISVVVMPDIGEADTPDKDVVKAVRLVAELLKDADTTYDVAAMAELYVELHDEAIQSCLDANGGYSAKCIAGDTLAFIYQGTKSTGTATTNLSNNRVTTAFIDSWTTAVRSNLEAVRRFSGTTLYLDGKPLDVSEGVGLSAHGSTKNFMLLDYYLQVSGVVNNAYDVAKPAVSEGTLPYLVIPGSGEDVCTKAVTQRSAPSALWYSQTGYGSSDAWTTVGDADFPALITRDAAMAKKVKASASRTNGIYNVGQPYEVWVAPSGLSGSWADGTVESFLIAPWAYCMFQLDKDMGVCSQYVDSFYQSFYRCSYEDALSDYQTVYAASCPVADEA